MKRVLEMSVEWSKASEKIDSRTKSKNIVNRNQLSRLGCYQSTEVFLID